MLTWAGGALHVVVFQLLWVGGAAPPAASRCSARKLAAHSFPRRPPAKTLAAIQRTFTWWCSTVLPMRPPRTHRVSRLTHRVSCLTHHVAFTAMSWYAQRARAHPLCVAPTRLRRAHVKA